MIGRITTITLACLMGATVLMHTMADAQQVFNMSGWVQRFDFSGTEIGSFELLQRNGRRYEFTMWPGTTMLNRRTPMYLANGASLFGSYTHSTLRFVRVDYTIVNHGQRVALNVELTGAGH